ncbi:DoxX family protein [Tenacibaculum sp. S7007]|uniref:DoxX family protein n=1 Tax=Tenacibaculum pelagium TaxID=2759527 RepID=A0A839ANY8_9FLAO|nr:DoxX family protein [Tenacibaculum pelagium]MBA6155441.1 DoxX family protein [Tenacibaculum pelagium]
MTIEKIINLVLSLVLGGMLIYGGIGKFSKENPSPNQVVAKAQKFQQPEKTETLQKILYINGMKQTGYMWQFLGAMQILCGVLLISQVFTLLGAIMAFPIVVNIFFFHLFLEFDETSELLQTLGLLLINVWFLIVVIRKMKAVLFQPEQLQFLNK